MLFQVFLDSPVILNGICVRWKGYVNLEKLDGVGGFKFDEDAARIEDLTMQQQVESYKHALREWDEQQQRYRSALQARQQQQQQTAASASSAAAATSAAGGAGDGGQ